MKENKYYFDYLIDKINRGEFRKVEELKDGNGFSVKFGDGVLMSINYNTGRATIHLHDSSVDIVPIIEAVNAARERKASERLQRAQEQYDRVSYETGIALAEPKKTFLQRLFKR
jgi:hypothetical protein